MDRTLAFGSLGLDTVLSLAGGSTFITSYAHDTLLPFSVYYFSKIVTGENKYLLSLGVFGLCSAGEIAQKLGLYHGTYDPRDFIAYGVGAALALGIETARESRHA